MKNHRIAAALLAVAAMLAMDASAQVKPEDQIKIRRSAYTLIGFNFGSLSAMAQDKKPYNMDEAVLRGAEIQRLANLAIGLQILLLVFFVIYGFFVPMVTVLEKLSRTQTVDDI